MLVSRGPTRSSRTAIRTDPFALRSLRVRDHAPRASASRGDAARASTSRPADDRNVFVTVGTTSFDALVEALDNPAVVNILRARGYNSLTMQIGRGTYRPRRVRTRPGFRVDIFDFRPSLDEAMRAASLVVSHAGAGSVFEALDARPRSSSSSTSHSWETTRWNSRRNSEGEDIYDGARAGGRGGGTRSVRRGGTRAVPARRPRENRIISTASSSKSDGGDDRTPHRAAPRAA